jgi:uncharacterized membrane protein YdbT with pleckstrin-like domain
MAYYTKVLQPGETVRIVGQLHWLVFARSFALVPVAAAVALAAEQMQEGDAQRAALLAAGVLLIIASLVFLGEYIRRACTEIVVTDHRIIYKRGVIARHTVEMNISKIETVDVDQGLGGRLLDYGTILVKGTGESIEPLRHIASPLAIRNAITIG